jgi:hypothetical protein
VSDNVDAPTTKFGEALRAQVEERLLFFEVGLALGVREMRIRLLMC